MRLTGSLWTTTFHGRSRSVALSVSSTTTVSGIARNLPVRCGSASRAFSRSGRHGRSSRGCQKTFNLLDPFRKTRVLGIGLHDLEHLSQGAIRLTEGNVFLCAVPQKRWIAFARIFFLVERGLVLHG